MIPGRSARHGTFVRMFGSAIIIQALLSATSFFVGLMLIRRASDSQYGYYVLINNAVLFASGFHTAFVQPPLVLMMAPADAATRAGLVGGLYRELRRLRSWGAAILFSAVALLWACRLITPEVALLAAAATALIVVTLHRESYRMVLLTHRRSFDVLRADSCYVIAVVSIVPFATWTSAPAATVVFVLAAAAMLSGLLMSRFLRQSEPWDATSRERVLRKLAPVGGWSAAGSTTHWAFSQGYNYVVAAALDIPAVAALGATRLLMMPVNLLSTGVISLMMPTATSWLNAHGAATVFRRLLAVANAVAALALGYFVVLWLARDAIFAHLLHKNFAHRDALLLIWGAVFMVMIFRDQLQFLLGASALYRQLTALTALAAVVSLTFGYFAMLRYGIIGASTGVLVGELMNLSGIVFLSLRCIRRAGARDLSVTQVS